MAEETKGLPKSELLVKWAWDVLPSYPPYPPLPRGLLRGVFGRGFEQKFFEAPSPVKGKAS